MTGIEEGNSQKKNPSFNSAFSFHPPERRQIPPTHLVHTSDCDDGFEKKQSRVSKETE